MNTDKNFLITLNREMGSGGRTVGRILSEKLGVRHYDKAVLEGLISHFHLTMEEIERIKARRQNWWTELCQAVVPAPAFDYKHVHPGEITTSEIFSIESKILRDIAYTESCVITGRAGFFVLKDHPNMISVFIRASEDNRVARICKRQPVTRDEAVTLIRKVDKDRETYTKYYAGRSRYDARNYDLVLNMDHLTEDDAADCIINYIRKSGK